MVIGWNAYDPCVLQPKMNLQTILILWGGKCEFLFANSTFKNQIKNLFFIVMDASWKIFSFFLPDTIHHQSLLFPVFCCVLSFHFVLRLLKFSNRRCQNVVRGTQGAAEHVTIVLILVSSVIYYCTDNNNIPSTFVLHEEKATFC